MKNGDHSNDDRFPYPHHDHLCLYACESLFLSFFDPFIGDLVHFTIASSGYPLLLARVCRRVYLSRYIERRYARRDYPQNVSHYDYVTLRSRCSVRHVRSRGRGSYVISKKGTTSLSRYSYFLYARSGTAALPIHYRGLNIFTA